MYTLSRVSFSFLIYAIEVSSRSLFYDPCEFGIAASSKWFLKSQLFFYTSDHKNSENFNTMAKYFTVKFEFKDTIFTLLFYANSEFARPNRWESAWKLARDFMLSVRTPHREYESSDIQHSLFHFHSHSCFSFHFRPPQEDAEREEREGERSSEEESWRCRRA